MPLIPPCAKLVHFKLTPAQMLRRQYNECHSLAEALDFARSMLWEIEQTKQGKRCTFCRFHAER